MILPLTCFARVLSDHSYKVQSAKSLVNTTLRSLYRIAPSQLALALRLDLFVCGEDPARKVTQVWQGIIAGARWPIEN